MAKAKSKKRLTGKQRARRAFKVASSRFQEFRDAELKKFKKSHGRKPRSFDEYAALNKRAGAAYRRKYH